MKIFKSKAAMATGSLALIITLGGCTTTDPVRVEQDFGQSVRHMVNSQIYDHEAARNPQKSPPKGLDGMQAEAVMDVYRKQVGNPDEVNKSLRIDVSD